jgi:hypothetical protein
MKIEITEQDIKNGFRDPISEKTIQQEQKRIENILNKKVVND